MYRSMLFLRGPYGSHLGGAQFLWFAFLFGLIWFGDKWADKPGGLPWFFFFERKQNFPLLNDAESSAITETRIGPPSDCLSYLGQPTHTLPYYKIVVIAGLKRN